MMEPMLLWLVLLMIVATIATYLSGFELRAFMLALSLRSAVWTAHYLDFTLPFTGKDDQYFTESATAVVAGEFRPLKWDGADLFIRILSWLISTFGASYATVSAMGVVAGSVTAVVAVRLANRMLPGTNSRLLYLPAAHPMLVLTSVIVLREVWIQAFVGFSLYSLFLAWSGHRHRQRIYYVAGIALLLAGGMLHSGILAMIVGLTVGVGGLLARELVRGRVDTRLGVTVLLGIVALAIVASTGLGLRKFQGGGNDGFATVGDVSTRLVRLEEGGSGFDLPPISSVRSMTVQIPVRMVYMVAGPLPIHYRSPADVLAGIDGALWTLLFGSAVVRRKQLPSGDFYLVTLTALTITIAAFALGTGTFGTALRHRTKFLPWLLPLGIAALLWTRYESAQHHGLEGEQAATPSST